MQINEETVKKVAKIARIPLEEQEVRQFAKEFESILSHFSKIEKVKTENNIISPLSTKNIFREDEIEPSLQKAEILKNTKNQEGDFFVSPKIK